MKLLGLILIVLSIVWPVPYYWELAAQYDNEALLSQYLGSVSLILMGINQFLATRVKGIEFIFGSLDRIYVLHKWLGIIAISCMMLHDTVDAELRKLGPEIWVSEIAEESGEIALYGLLILLVISLTTFVPYDFWKRTHKFIGAFFALSAFHYLFILKPFGLNDPLGLYVSAFCIIGILSYLYTLSMHSFGGKYKPYKVSSITQDQGITRLTLHPINSSHVHKAGQFAFLQVNGESHPFTIASAHKKNGQLDFAIKGLGNFSKGLPSTLQENTTVHVSSPYGHFQLPSDKQQVWIAGGIGITPFLAWLECANNLSDKDIHLYYCVRSNEPVAPLEERLVELCHNQSNVKLHIVNSTTMPRLTFEQIKQDVGADIKNTAFSFCGPKALRKKLQKELQSQSLNYEEFEFRSGVETAHLQSFLLWLLPKISKLIQRKT